MSVLSSSSVISLPSKTFVTNHHERHDFNLELLTGFIPTTVISADNEAFSFRVDDVFDNYFLEIVILIRASLVATELSALFSQYLCSIGVKRVGFVVDRSLAASKKLLDGPYFSSNEGLFRLWKLFPDSQSAFVASLYMNASIPEAAPNLAIAVPSQLYYPPSANKHLNGLRVTIKDNINIARVKTFTSSKAYGELYGSVSQSAPAIQRLLDLGVVIVGKTGMSQFADAEDPTGDCVDFHAPWNPRGDGLRSPGGSSFAGRSVRVPAASQSVYGFRPSRGTVSIDSVVLIHNDLDIIGVLSRNYHVLELVSQHLFHTTPSIIEDHAEDTRPTLIYPTHLFPIEDKAAQNMYDKTVSALKNTVEREEGQYHEKATFRAEYQAKFGRQPYVNPLAQLRWINRARMQPEHFKRFIDGIFGSRSFMVTPFKFGEPEARDIFRLAPAERVRKEFSWGMRPAFQSPMAGQPEIVFPVSQLPVFSQASHVKEKYGVIASLLGSRDMDMEILETVKSQAYKNQFYAGSCLNITQAGPS
ncbi:amidase signature enzyme [Mollisia scopiformis]|uniref:Amidase signature enzyme n=1 Tax=Mollisia scopiformis TaxID=149040 RepID=A0A132B1A5_MOLSC|nr:amidase signature enzyme [Mollisia scopiformis]KUJ06160.1 amidase signature enzyme [Mollisia scopiformis]